MQQEAASGLHGADADPRAVGRAGGLPVNPSGRQAFGQEGGELTQARQQAHRGVGPALVQHGGQQRGVALAGERAGIGVSAGPTRLAGKVGGGHRHGQGGAHRGGIAGQPARLITTARAGGVVPQAAQCQRGRGVGGREPGRDGRGGGSRQPDLHCFAEHVLGGERGERGAQGGGVLG